MSFYFSEMRESESGLPRSWAISDFGEHLAVVGLHCNWSVCCINMCLPDPGACCQGESTSWKTCSAPMVWAGENAESHNQLWTWVIRIYGKHFNALKLFHSTQPRKQIALVFFPQNSQSFSTPRTAKKLTPLLSKIVIYFSLHLIIWIHMSLCQTVTLTM